MSFFAIAHVIALLLAGLFGSSAALHLAAPGFLRHAYRRGGFAPGVHYTVGFIQAVVALFLAVPQIRIWGGILGGMVLFVTVIALLNRGKYLYAVPLILAMAALAPAMA